VCNERVWYQKWRYDPAIVAAFDACYARALEFADAETATLEEHYRRRRRRSLAKIAAQAPAALAEVMDGKDQRGSDRISAADTLMRWAEPDTAMKVGAPPRPGGDNIAITEVVVEMPPDEPVAD
jgi:hypothetical protein